MIVMPTVILLPRWQLFDVVIQTTLDGMHSIGASLNTLNFGLRHVWPGGFVVIKDIMEQRTRFSGGRSHPSYCLTTA